MRVVLICPRCKTRTEVSFEDYCVSLLPSSVPYVCDNQLCEMNKLIYHKEMPDVK